MKFHLHFYDHSLLLFHIIIIYFISSASSLNPLDVLNTAACFQLPVR